MAGPPRAWEIARENDVLTAGKPLRLYGAVLVFAALGGCAANVRMEPPTIPTPLIEKMPVAVGVRIPAEFQHYVHEESVLGREEWTIDLGSSNAALFTQLFGFMFEELEVLGPDDDASTFDIDALIEPSIDAFEFSVPKQSRTDAFAVWIRYRLKVYDRKGDIVANWPVSAYGKSQTTAMAGSDALRRAAVLAMRDAAAVMILKLDAETGISGMGDTVLPAVTPAPAGGEQTEVQTTALEGAKDDAG